MKKIGVLLLLVGVAVPTANAVVVRGVRRVLADYDLSFGATSSEARPGPGAEVAPPPEDLTGQVLAPSPFREVSPFDEDAHDWSNRESHYAAGLLVFDANGDGRLDAYFLQDGQNWTRATDAKGVLEDKPRYQRNGLYLNMGNDESGAPVFTQVSELARANPTEVEAELRVEGFLFPRTSVDDSLERPGRAANVAVAADFNADGRMDLLIGNEPQGMPRSDPGAQQLVNRFVNPIGREARFSKQPLGALGNHLIQYTPRQSLKDTRQSARGEEAEGANTLYLNQGDSDGDGIPEWIDASRAAGIEGFRPTWSLTVIDFDLDGDLDVFEANTHDPDYWVGGARAWAGGADAFYVNQLAETGQLTFVEKAAELGVDGVFDEDRPIPDYYRLRRIPWLPQEYSALFARFEPYKPEVFKIDGVPGENAEISWASVAQDVNSDGYPDLWVANDLGFLRLFVNDGGKGFKDTPHARSRYTGWWMSFAPADFDGDGKEDLYAGNMGGAIVNNAFVSPNPFELFEPTITAASYLNFDPSHSLIDGADFNKELISRVRHSTVLPPDVALPGNYRGAENTLRPKGMDMPPFDPGSLDPYEFAWGAMVLDVQNDGRMDLYWLGSMYGRGGGVFATEGTGPGRLLVNTGAERGVARLADLTAEHHVFDIEELRYDRLTSHGYIYRPSPLQNWGKRDMVYSHDRSNWVSQGAVLQKRVVNQDLLQASENGRAVVAGDLNGDGYADLLIRNKGGYDSRRSNSSNLKVRIDGVPRVIPAHDGYHPSPTNYEPGRTHLWLNTYQGQRWLKVRLIDDRPGRFNPDAVGAVVTVNGSQAQVVRAGSGGFISNLVGPLLFGLGTGAATSVDIRWPDQAGTVTHIDLENLQDTTITVSSTRGLVWQP